MTRHLMTGIFCLLLCLPSVTQAGLVLNGGNQLIGAQGGLNEFGNLSGQGVTFNSSTINGFPSSGSASPVALAASASLDFLYTQNGDEATFLQTITQSQEGVDFGLAEHRFTIEFTAINDLNFMFTSNYSGLGTAGSPTYAVFLQDLTTLGFVFSDNSQDPLDLNPVENHSGMLLAGHNYSLNGASRLYAGDVGSGVPASASGTYIFTTSSTAPAAVPEPASLTIAGMGALSFAIGSVLRRRQQPVATKSSKATVPRS